MPHVSLISSDEFCDGHGRAAPALAGGLLTGGSGAGMAGVLGTPGDPRLDALLPFALVFVGLFGIALVVGSALRLSPRALGGVGLAAWLLVALAAAPLAWTAPVGGDLATAAEAERRILLRAAGAVEAGLTRLTGGGGFAGLATACAAGAGGSDGGSGGGGGSSGGSPAAGGTPGGDARAPGDPFSSGGTVVASVLGFSFAPAPPAGTGGRPPTPAQATAPAAGSGSGSGSGNGGSGSAPAAGGATSGAASGGSPGGSPAGGATGSGTAGGSATGGGTATAPPQGVCAALRLIERLSGTDLTTAEGGALDDLGDALRQVVAFATADGGSADPAREAQLLLGDLSRLSAALGDRSLAEALERATGSAPPSATAPSAAASSGSPGASASGASSRSGSGGSGGASDPGAAAGGGTGGSGGAGSSGSGGGASETGWPALLAGLSPFLLTMALALFAARAAAVLFGWVRAPRWPYPEVGTV